MPDADKNIVITPYRGSTLQPQVVFTGQGVDPITLRVLDGATGTGITAGGALSFEGSAGQLFSVVNRLGTGSIFSVNDISGIPSIDVDASGRIHMAAFTGFVGIGITGPQDKLDINGSLRVSAGISASGATFGNSVSIGVSGGFPTVMLRGLVNTFQAQNGGSISFLSGVTTLGLRVIDPGFNETNIKPKTHEIEFYDNFDGDTVNLNAGLVVGGGNYTVTLPGYQTTLAGLGGEQTFTALKSFSAGISASGGVTFNSTIISNGYRYSSSIFDSRTSGFTLSASDAGKTFLIGSCAASTNIYCPTGLPVGFQCDVIRRAAAGQRIRIFESDTTIESKTGNVPELTNSSFGGEQATIMQIETNVYVVYGDI